MGNQVKQDDFDEFLKTRYVPKAPSNLSERIIEEARKQSEAAAKKPSLGDRLREFLQGFEMPQPAYVFGSFMLVAAVVGIFAILNLPSADMPLEIYDLYAEDGVALAFYVDDLLWEPGI